MRTYNKHPQWYNQPLRLSEEEKRNPVIVINEFFQCYHLHEARQMLWYWIVEVLSSNHGISCDPHERSNQIYFYEKLEALIESALVIQKRAHKNYRRRKRKSGGRR